MIPLESSRSQISSVLAVVGGSRPLRDCRLVELAGSAWSRGLANAKKDEGPRGEQSRACHGRRLSGRGCALLRARDSLVRGLDNPHRCGALPAIAGARGVCLQRASSLVT